MNRKPTDLVAKEPNNLTIGELREKLGPKEITILLSKPEEDYGVVIAQGRGLAFIIQAAKEHRTHISDYAQGVIDKMEDPEMSKTLAELKAEIPNDGISLITRDDGGPEDRLLSLVATGDAALAIFNMLDAHGFLDPEPDSPGEFRCAQA